LADDVAPDGLAARRRLYLALALFVLGVSVGAAWDRRWHTQNLFDSFYSPPHLFIYSMVALTMATVASIVFTRRLREAFGPGVALPLLPVPVPPALLFLSGALGVMGLAGALDDAWHTAFGLDETNWSLPHAMLGWGIFLSFAGFASCRVALVPFKPISAFGLFSFGFILLSASVNIILGPIGNNNTPQTVAAVSQFGTLPLQPSAQHTFRIYLEWNLDRTSPLLPLLGALASGVGLAILRAFTKRTDLFLLVAVAGSVITLVSDRALVRALEVEGGPAGWLPLPILPAALVFVWLTRRGVADERAWAVAGLTFGLLCLAVWGDGWLHLAFALAGGPAMLAGARLGASVHRIIESPTREQLAWFVPVVGVLLPAVTGAVDLYLRMNTP
jgi:hypothetical protein